MVDCVSMNVNLAVSSLTSRKVSFQLKWAEECRTRRKLAVYGWSLHWVTAAIMSCMVRLLHLWKRGGILSSHSGIFASIVSLIMSKFTMVFLLLYWIIRRPSSHFISWGRSAIGVETSWDLPRLSWGTWLYSSRLIWVPVHFQRALVRSSKSENAQISVMEIWNVWWPHMGSNVFA